MIGGQIVEVFNVVIVRAETVNDKGFDTVKITWRISKLLSELQNYWSVSELLENFRTTDLHII